MDSSRFSLSSLSSEVFRSENVSDQEMRPGYLSRIFAGLGLEKKRGFWRVRWRRSRTFQEGCRI